MFDEILVAFDGSEASRKASDAAVELAEQIDGEVHYVEVIDITGFPNPIDWDNIIDRIHLERSEELEDNLEAARDRDVYGGSRVTRGIPRKEILDRAESLEADLIVMGEKTNSGVAGIMGSTLRRVLENSVRPVMAVDEEGERWR